MERTVEPVIEEVNAKLKVKSNSLKIGGSSDEKDEKAPDSSDNGGIHKNRIGKPKKRKKPKDVTAPRQPLTGYVRYLNDRRETVRTANPNLPFAEITRILASEWSNLPTDKKQHYLDAAIQDKERYNKEYNAYKQTQAYKAYTKQLNEKKFKENKEEKINIPIATHTVVSRDSNDDIDVGNCDIPIFTEEFLDHNKNRDAELRQLRKSNTDYEQQNAILQKHIENVKNAIEKLENEIIQQKRNNKLLQQHLDHLRITLTDGFSNVKLPGVEESPSIHTIDTYMSALHSTLSENNSQDVNLVHTIRSIVASLEFKG